MTAKKLEEIRKKFEQKEGDINDVGEIVCDFYSATSAFLKKLEKQMLDQKTNQEIIYSEIYNIKELLNPVYTIIQHDD